MKTSLPTLLSFGLLSSVHAVTLLPSDINGGDTNRSLFNDGTLKLTPTLGGAVATFNGGALRLGIDGNGTNNNAFNDPDTNPNNGNEEGLIFELAANASLTQISWDFSRADGPGANDGVVISGFLSDPGATLSGAVSNSSVTYNNGALNLQIAGSNFGDPDGILSLASPEASAGQTLTLTVGDTTQAGAQLAITSISYEEEATPLPDPLVRLTFDDADFSGGLLQDQSPNDNDGVILPSETAPLTSQAGLFNESYRFLGGDDPTGLVAIDATVMPSGAEARTFSIWFNAQDTSGQAQLFGYGAEVAGEAFYIGMEEGGIRLRHFGGNITYGSGLDFTSSDAGWQHLAVRVNDGASTFADVDVFLNGTLLPVTATGGGGTTVALNTADSIFGLGASSSSAAGFDGFLDEFQAFDLALPAGNIRELAERPPVPTIVSFAASPQNRVPAGSAVTLSWEVENTTSLILNPGNIDVTGQTSLVVNPNVKTTYTLTATDDSLNSAEEDVTLTIGDEPFPNIIVFFLDDFGWSDWEQNGASTGSVFYETPRMNQMATEGMYFPNGYASSPVCSPTRGALLSGQAPAFNKLTQWIPGSGDSGQPIREAEWLERLPTDLPNWPRTLAECGYRSIHVGKWHLGSGTEPSANPINHGFEINIGGNQFGTPPGPERYFASAGGFTGLPNMGPDVAPQGSYLTDVLTEQAVAQIKDAASSNTAFAMYLSHYAVHTPIQAPAATVAKYQAKLDNNPGMDWQGHTNPTYAAMIEHVDLSIGAIMDTLRDPDGDPATNDSIAENTLVILTADNGGLLPVTSNRPLRNGKGGTYDGGIREPWIFWSPGNVDAGVINPEPVVTHDILPTVLSFAGVPTPENHVVNGADLTPLLTGEEFERERPFTFHYPHWSPSNQIGEPYSAIRKGDWKLIYTYANQNWELYNLATNPEEDNNLIASEEDLHAVLSWMLSNDLEALEANYPRNLQTLAEEPPVPLVSPENDADGDGQNDLEEAIQGTDADDATSFFDPEFGTGDEEAFFSFTPVAERRYALEASSTLLPDSWTVIDETLPLGETGPLQPRRFYRIVTSFP